MRGLLQFARLLLLIALSRGVRTYNVDDLARTVLTSGLSESSVAEELFGFSMAHHRYSDGSQALFVGAPHAFYNDSEFGNLAMGQVYRCEIANGSQCEPDPIFNSRDDSVAKDFFDDPPFVLQTEGYALAGQLLGYSVRSFGTGGIIACAPKYLDNLNTIPPPRTGRCVYFEQDFNSSSLPLQYDADRFPDDTFFLGTDAMFTDVSGPALFMGAGNGFGAVYGIPLPTVQSSELEESDQIGIHDGYYGYHLERANFSDVRGNVLMSGPVGSQHCGEIVPMQYLLTSDGIDVQQIFINTLASFTGPEDQPDSYFGYDFAVLQLQRDGYDSIVVGCPLCASDKGEVYVYLHKGITPTGVWTNFVDMSRIEAPGFQKGRFGMQVENIGDIDLDGFDDLAVSAPYVDNGVVYIFRGTQTGLSQLIQTIRPRTGIRGFGYVLTGNFDVDGNNYNDFAVGGFPNNSTGSIEILRSSPVMIVVPSFKEGSGATEVQVNSTSCVVQGRRLLCFNLTACFDLSTVEGDVQEFAFNYTLNVDEEMNRVILSENFRTAAINRRYVAVEGFSCDEPITFVLLGAETASIPASLAVIDSDDPLMVDSPQDNTFGGSLTPVLGRYIAGNINRTLSADILMSLDLSCGDDGVCKPTYLMELEYNVSTVYFASRFRFGFEMSLTNIGEDGFGSFLEIYATRGIVLDSFASITDFAIDRCNTSLFEDVSFIRCLLQNHIESETTVRAGITLRPDLGEIELNVSRLELNFTVGYGNQPDRVFEVVVLESTSIAGYELNAGFGDNDIQASFILPSVDFETTPVRDLGVLVAYTITLSPTLNDSVGSTIPRTVATISWPTAIRDESGNLNPLLIIVEETSISATCEQMNLYPYDLLDQPVFADISKPVTNTRCPSNITCGILQCTFINLAPISAGSTSAAPLNVLIQAILYGPSVRGAQDIPVYVSVESESEYPRIVESMRVLDTTTLLTVTQAVTEFAGSDSCSLVPFIITIIVSAVFGLVVVLIVLVAMGGKKGQYYLEHREDKKILDLKKSEQDVVDGSFNVQHGTRTIPPPGEIDLGTELKKPKLDLSKSEEAELEDQMRSKHLEAVLDPESPGETEL